MKKLLSFFFLLNLMSSLAFSQLSKTQITIGGNGLDLCNYMAQTNDGGYVMTGWTSSFGAGEGDMYVVKLDSNAEISWTKTIGGGRNDGGANIIQTSDGGYASIGWSHSFGTGNEKPEQEAFNTYLIKLNPSGGVTWTKTYTDSNFYGYGHAIIQTRDLGYAIAVNIFKSITGDSSNIMLMKLDTVGNIGWATNISGKADNGVGYHIVQTTDGGYALAGYTGSYGAGFYNVYVLKFDSSGNVSWTETIGGTNDDIASAIIQTRDGGYAITGQTYSFGDTVNGDVYVIKLNSAGVIEWTKTVGGDKMDIGQSIIQTRDGGYAITGQTYSYGDRVNGNVYVIKMDSLGEVKWTRSMGSAGEDEGESIVQTKDGGYAIGGVYDFGAGGKAYFIKLDSSGHTCSVYDSGGIVGSGGTITSKDSGRIHHRGRITSIDSGIVSSGGTYKDSCGLPSSINNITINVNNVEIYPVPASSEVTFKISWGENKYITITDITGKEIETMPILNNRIQVNVSAFPAGIYFYEIIDKANNIIDRGKLSVAK